MVRIKRPNNLKRAPDFDQPSFPKQPTELPATQRPGDITITRDEGKPTTSLISRLAVESLKQATFNPRLRHRRQSKGNPISLKAAKGSDGSEIVVHTLLYEAFSSSYRFLSVAALAS